MSGTAKDRCKDCGFERQSVSGYFGCLCMGFGNKHVVQADLDAAVRNARMWKKAHLAARGSHD